ncbi:ribulokinase [Vibrio hannami]|uniref:ribulokinase n=1 Tax=Vibrio hannami TaxID=2717094 RepID=UPI002410361A|nr:ribulokinase [Vibrio hannami]MDG3085377.1 ribulokinase [Vibrio hannami]
MNNTINNQAYTIGLDFGSDSVRALIVNAETGTELATAVTYYPRWMEGKYCIPSQSQFRHHPRDYLEAMTQAIQEAVSKVSVDIADAVVGIGVDSTGSTPAPIDAKGNVLALLPEFENNPNAMFILWKDHTSVEKAELINSLAHSNEHLDYTRYIGGIYSSEWFWAKAAWISEKDSKVAQNAYSWVELCDWIPAILSGNQHPEKIRRGICAAGHKAMWHESWGGLPSQRFLSAISPTLDGIRDRMFTEVYTADQQAGKLTKEWADKLGLPEGIAVAIGEFDCHMGAVGAGAEKYDLVKVIGTSTCDILMVEEQDVGDKTIFGICGQVKGSATPGLLALEAGQSAFGDIYAWYKRLLMWPIEQYNNLNPDAAIPVDKIEKSIIPMLTDASCSTVADSAIAVDWHNGRRTPYANQRLQGAIGGLNLGTDAPELFSALVESTAHGAKAIVDSFVEQGVKVDRVVAIGGISKKSPFVMQTCADVIGREIVVAESEQSCALGAAIFAAVAAGQYANTEEAQKVMASPICHTYKPQPGVEKLRKSRAEAYRYLGLQVEGLAEFKLAQEREIS